MPARKKKTTPRKTKKSLKLDIKVDGKPYDVPEEGSLGLLALGAAGLLAWRKKRKQVKGKES